MPDKKLYGAGQSVVLRSARTGTDASDWTPDNTAGGEDEVVLDSAEWEDVRVHVDYGGTIDGSETVTLQPMASRRNAAGAKVWYDLPEVILDGDRANDLVLCDGYDITFRITALTLGTASDVTVLVTSGTHDREVN